MASSNDSGGLQRHRSLVTVMINSNGSRLRQQRRSSIAGDKVGFSKNANKSFSVNDDVLFFRNAKEIDSLFQ